MKIDHCIQNFMEKYDEEAISSVEDLSKEIGMNNNYSIHTFNINEAFDTFNQVIGVYQGWFNKSLPGADRISIEQISENAHSIIDNQTFVECDIKYKDLPNFITSYLTGVKALTEKVENAKSDLLLENASYDIANKIDDFCDHFIESLDAKFMPVVENAVKSSGYYSRKNLHNPSTKKTPIFI